MAKIQTDQPMLPARSVPAPGPEQEW